MIDLDFLSQLKQFSLVINKRVTSNYTGPRRSVVKGQGLVFSDYRMYVPGDDFRAIDWKVFGRTDHLIVKTFEEERNMVVHVIIDNSASMNFGKKVTKFDYAAMLGVGFAYLALRDNERFQFASFSEDLKVFKSQKGRSQLITMVDYLNGLKTSGKSMLKDAVTRYKKYIDSRSFIVIISDFLLNIEEIKEALYRIGDHEVKIIQILDPTEKELNYEGDFKLEDSETNEVLRTFISARLRGKYRNLLDDHAALIRDSCHKLGYSFYQITTDKPIFDSFFEILE